MREIKFRAWFKRYKLMSSWAEVKESLDLVGILTNSRYIVMQYAGLKDKNGKEIYEGDIVRATKNYPGDGKGTKLFTSEFRTNTATFTFREVEAMSKDDSRYFYDNLQIRDIEIIGNIYENPELVNGN